MGISVVKAANGNETNTHSLNETNGPAIDGNIAVREQPALIGSKALR